MYESEDKMVSHPAHYLKGGMETIDVIEAFTEGLEGIEAYDTGNIIKYICRWKDKGGKQDLEKVMWYAQHLIDHLDAEDDDEDDQEDTIEPPLLTALKSMADRMVEAFQNAPTVKSCANCANVVKHDDGSMTCDDYDGDLPSMPISVTDRKSACGNWKEGGE